MIQNWKQKNNIMYRKGTLSVNLFFYFYKIKKKNFIRSTESIIFGIIFICLRFTFRYFPSTTIHKVAYCLSLILALFSLDPQVIPLFYWFFFLPLSFVFIIFFFLVTVDLIFYKLFLFIFVYICVCISLGFVSRVE